MRRWERLPEAQSYLDINEILDLLVSRGLVIRDRVRAAHYFRVIGYHRLRAYTRAYYRHPVNDKTFKPGTTFNDVINLYTLDRELRLLLMGPIEKIEISLRALIIDALGGSTAAGKLGKSRDNIRLLDEDHFNLETASNQSLYDSIGFACINEIYRTHGYLKGGKRPKFRENRELCKDLVHQFSAYHVVHSLTFGTLSKIFYIFKANPSKVIANHFDVHRASLRSVLSSLTKLRNACAHHEPIWFRQIVPMRFPENYAKFIYPDEMEIMPHEQQKQQLYIACAVIHILLSHISEITTWYSRLRPVIYRFEEGAQRFMGFPKDWDELPFWRTPDVRALAT